MPPEHLHEVPLNLPGLLHNVLVWVGNEVGLLIDLQTLIALLGEQVDEFPLQRRLSLVTIRAGFTGL